MKIYKISDLLIILIWIIIATGFAIFPSQTIFFNSTFDNIIKIIFGIPMVIFIPGYILMAALFPKKELLIIERIVLSFGVSIALIILLGLFLNFTIGIRLAQILFILSTYSIITIFIAISRRKKIPEKDQFVIPFGRLYENISNMMPQNIKEYVLYPILIFSVIIALSMAYFVIISPKEEEKFTEFYILNSSQDNYSNYTKDNYSNYTKDNYSNYTNYNYSKVNYDTLKLNSPNTISVGVVNHEYSAINYTFKINLDNDTLDTENLLLNNNDVWQKNVTFIPKLNKFNIDNGNKTKLEFLLFKDNNFSSPYRELHLWTNII